MKATPDPVPVFTSDPNGAKELKWQGHMADNIGATYGPEPFATLVATPTALVLSGTRGTFRIPRTAVRKLGRGKMYPWFFSAVRIHHDIPDYPTELQFKPLGARPQAVLAQLRELGYAGG